MRYLGLFLGVLSHLGLAEVSVRYTLEPRPQEASINIAVQIQGLQPGKAVEIQISKEFGSANDYYRDLENLEITFPSNLHFVNTQENGQLIPYRWRTVEPLAGQMLEFHYRIKVHQQFPGKIRFKPHLNAKNCYSNGYPLFAFPKNADSFSVDFTLPPGWRKITSLQSELPNRVATKSVDALLASTIALGNYQSSSYTLPNGVPLTIAVNGEWAFPRSKFYSAVYKLISSQIETMQSWHSPSYTVILNESVERGSSGSGLANAFEMFANGNVTLDDLYYVISHENFHYWNGNRIQYESAGDRWFSEGFTDYYAYLIINRIKLWPFKKSLEEISKSIQAYYENPVAQKITFDDAGKFFWNWLMEYGKLPYSKGILIALMSDVRLRSASDNRLSLDGFMMTLDKRYFESGRSVNTKLIQNELENYSGLDWQDFMNRFVLGKEMLPVNDFIRAGGMEIVDQTCSRADLGLIPMPYFCAPDKPCGYRAENVTFDGPAYRAGVREGDVISEWNPRFFQGITPYSAVKLGIQRGGGALSWYEYKAGEKTATCHGLSLTSHPTPLAKQIREAIWLRD